MGITTGIVKGQTIESYRGSPAVRLLQVQLLGPNPETVEFINVSGEDTAPATGDRVVVFNIGGGYKVTLGTKSQIIEAVSEGEKKIYSNNGSEILAFVYLDKNGKIQIGNGEDELLNIINENFVNLINSLKYLRDTITFTNSGGPTGPPTNGALLTPYIQALETAQQALGNIKL